MLPDGVVTVAYIGATILFILALGGLSHPETARRGNLYGMTGMAVALLATIFGCVMLNGAYVILFPLHSTSVSLSSVCLCICLSDFLDSFAYSVLL